MSELIHHLRNALADGGGRTDGQLLDNYLSRRDESALEALVRRHGPMVWGVCRRALPSHHDAEDAFQATFLVLVRKAAEVAPRERVANWLYGVAYHTARRARVLAAKRRRREQQVESLPEPAAPPEGGGQDLRPVLDQELRRLPDKYRAPIVLCDLEGKTHKEAAGQLGWPVGTLSGRLVRARALLAKRLARHGLALSGGAVAAGTASAAVPVPLLQTTVDVALRWAAGRMTVPGGVSVRAAVLAEGVLKAMLVNRIVNGTALLLVAAALVTGTGLLLTRAQGPGTPEAKAPPPGATPQEGPAEPQAAGRGQAARHPEKVPEVLPEVLTPEMLGAIYRTNDALADEKLTGKRIRVTGRLIRIRRVGGPGTTVQKVGYELDLGPADWEPAPAEAVYIASAFVPRLLLQFSFSPDDRAALAKLRQGQQVTVEGSCEGIGTAEGTPPVIHFHDAKIIKAEK